MQQRKDHSMSYTDIIRAWKDEAYRLSLGETEQALLPENPAGRLELTESELGAVVGGLKDLSYVTHGCFGCDL
jgi:mersacidin/lichenicidin family type 2 lantibiotic